MIVFYSFSIRCYVVLIRLASLFSGKARLWIRGRKNWKENLKHNLPSNPIWFHCASLGEFEMARPLIEKIKSEFPDQKILLTFFSPSGYEIRKSYPFADKVAYLPADTKMNAEYFVDTVKPMLVVFAKYDFWVNYLRKIKSSSIPAIAISSVFRSDQRFFKWYGSVFRDALTAFGAIYVQNETSAKLLASIHLKFVVAGDTRYDRVSEIAKLNKSIPGIDQFRANSKLIIAGSSWEAEEVRLCSFINSSNENNRFIFAPHDIGESHLSGIEKLLKKKYARFSEWKSNPDAAIQVLIVDNIGMLSSLYHYAEIAIVGGGFSGKLHNVLEPAASGCVVMFGPKHKRFHEAQELIDNKAAIEISDNFNKQLQDLLSNEQMLNECRQNAKQFTTSKTGATNRIFNDLLPILKNS